MRITLVLPQPPAYSETFFRSKIKGLQESGHEVILVTATTAIKFDECPHVQHPEIHRNFFIQAYAMVLTFFRLIPYFSQVLIYIKLQKKDSVGFKRIIEKLYLNSTLLRLKTDWLHFGFATMAVDRELVAKAIGARLAVSFRGYDIEVYPNKNKEVFNKLWDHLDKVHSISDHLYIKAKTLGLPRSAEKQIINPGIDLSSLELRGINEKILHDKAQILTIARLHWIKGIDDLIETAFLLKKNNIKFQWQIIGDGDNKHKERFMYHIHKKNLSSHVFLLGKQSHQFSLTQLQKASLYVQTSISEGFCNAALEAQAFGKPTIVTDGGGLSENVIDGETGWVVKRSEPHVLSQKIIDVLNLSESEKNKIGVKAMQRVENEFSLEQQKIEFNQFYKVTHAV